VVAAHVFLDPKADFMAMNKVWGEEFGTPAQPNKPARAAFRTSALVAPGAMLEIEFIAAKKPGKKK
jgi:enamine deaminase RidA (YjgF/YER057c/UK114 family)